nr:hypothetical protein [Tanacetum cinerariifolium]
MSGTTVVSFSGGRTSAYMLHQVLDSNDHLGDLIVTFANTGKEHPATLDFVQECSERWAVPIVWLEYRDDERGFAIVNYETASRDGQPFEDLIRKRSYLPNPVTRFCTIDLKIRVIHKYLRMVGCSTEETPVDMMTGIRADEPRRVAKIRYRKTTSESKHATMVMPLADAGVGVQDVTNFWKEQPFDLMLPTINGRTCSTTPTPNLTCSPITTRRLPASAVTKQPSGALARLVAGDFLDVAFRKHGKNYFEIRVNNVLPVLLLDFNSSVVRMRVPIYFFDRVSHELSVPEYGLGFDPQDDEIVVDFFCGGGGAGTGLEMGLGRKVSVAKNHSAKAISMHTINHPGAKHFTTDVFDGDPDTECGGKAGRGVLVKVVAGPGEIVPVGEQFLVPNPKRKGSTWKRFVELLEQHGYVVEWRVIKACDFGAPTSRERLFMIARCDGLPIVWPEPTHAKKPGKGQQKYRTAAECINFGDLGKSIFGRKDELADATKRRIAKGI